MPYLLQGQYPSPELISAFIIYERTAKAVKYKLAQGGATPTLE